MQTTEFGVLMKVMLIAHWYFSHCRAVFMEPRTFLLFWSCLNIGLLIGSSEWIPCFVLLIHAALAFLPNCIYPKFLHFHLSSSLPHPTRGKRLCGAELLPGKTTTSLYEQPAEQFIEGSFMKVITCLWAIYKFTFFTVMTNPTIPS